MRWSPRRSSNREVQDLSCALIRHRIRPVVVVVGTETADTFVGETVLQEGLLAVVLALIPGAKVEVASAEAGRAAVCDGGAEEAPMPASVRAHHVHRILELVRAQHQDDPQTRDRVLHAGDPTCSASPGLSLVRGTGLDRDQQRRHRDAHEAALLRGPPANGRGAQRGAASIRPQLFGQPGEGRAQGREARLGLAPASHQDGPRVDVTAVLLEEPARELHGGREVQALLVPEVRRQAPALLHALARRRAPQQHGQLVLRGRRPCCRCPRLRGDVGCRRELLLRRGGCRQGPRRQGNELLLTVEVRGVAAQRSAARCSCRRQPLEGGKAGVLAVGLWRRWWGVLQQDIREGGVVVGLGWAVTAAAAGVLEVRPHLGRRRVVRHRADVVAQVLLVLHGRHVHRGGARAGAQVVRLKVHLVCNVGASGAAIRHPSHASFGRILVRLPRAGVEAPHGARPLVLGASRNRGRRL
mmetsp:Transcript_122526/g.392075  ORF Transcript_122526/g.392075 Transcript_122526/m.392075 type:complete len:469 (+) Transcript_122526:339-1745(+)